tara:strand:+ start:111 stop:530 length:420 start_codon:yes stop_codon:yes gene_type:complete
MDITIGELLGYIGTTIGAIFIWYKEVYKKKQEARLAEREKLNAADIRRQENKDKLDMDAQQVTLAAYTELNGQVFDLFKTYLSEMKKDLVETKAEVNTIKNFCDGFDRQLDEITNKVNEIAIKLEAAKISQPSNEKKDS